MFVEQGGSGGLSERDLGAMSLAVLERRIEALAAAITATTALWLGFVAEFDRRDGHQQWGFASCSGWLAWRCSLTPRSAREHLRVARSLRELPRIREAFATGSLSFSKARALTRVAEPALEQELLELASSATAAQLERILRGYRQAICPDAERRASQRRGLSLRWEDDGTLAIAGSLPPEEGELLLEALEAARRALRRAPGDPEPDQPSIGAIDAATSAGTGRVEPGGGPEPDQDMPGPQPDRADALMALAETALTGGISDATGGDRSQLVVHVALSAERGAAGPGTGWWCRDDRGRRIDLGRGRCGASAATRRWRR